MNPSVGPEADRELTEGALYYAREGGAELGIAFETSLVLKNTAGKESIEFRGRESITFAVTIRNRSDSVRTLTLPSSQTHECIVYSEKNQEVWRWSAGRRFAQVITEMSFAPGESRSFTATRNLTDRKGAPLPPGDFCARKFARSIMRA